MGGRERAFPNPLVFVFSGVRPPERPMLLRRVIEHVHNQNWFAVCLDFVIVVVGVFIGIQVANWNDTRADRLLEAETLRNIGADLRRDQQSLSDGIRYATASIDAANYRVTSALRPVDSTTVKKLVPEEDAASSSVVRVFCGSDPRWVTGWQKRSRATADCVRGTNSLAISIPPDSTQRTAAVGENLLQVPGE